MVIFAVYSYCEPLFAGIYYCNVLASTHVHVYGCPDGGTVETWKRSFISPVHYTVETSKLSYGGNEHFESY